MATRILEGNVKPVIVSSPNIEHKQTAEGYHLLIDMPGLSKEDVKLKVVENILIITGEGKNEFGFGDKDGINRNYRATVGLSPKTCKVGAIKAEMNNGVLKAFVPKIKDEERSDVFHVNIN